MGIFSRLSDIVNSNLNAMLDKAEDPERIIRLIVQEMEDTLVEIRSSTVKAIADKKETERKIGRLEQERDEWQRKAEFALAKGREDLAKGALMAKAKIAETIGHLQQQLKHIDEALAKSSEDIAKLQAKLTDAKNREKAIVARSKSAAQRLQVRTKGFDDRIADAFARFEMVERNLDEMEGKVEAFDIGRKKSLSEEIADLEADDAVSAELEALKARVKGGASTEQA